MTLIKSSLEGAFATEISDLLFSDKRKMPYHFMTEMRHDID